MYLLISGERRLLMLSQLDEEMAAMVTRIVDDYMLLSDESKAEVRAVVSQIICDIESQYVNNE